MFKKYKLLKEWPDAKVGDVYQWNGQGYSNQTRTAMVISKNYVEKYSEWFEEILEKVVITGFLKWGANDIILYGNSPLYIHFEKIKKAIENVLNDAREVPLQSEKLYTEEELLEAEEKAFFIAAKTFMCSDRHLSHSGRDENIRSAFDSYKNSTSKQ